MTKYWVSVAMIIASVHSQEFDSFKSIFTSNVSPFISDFAVQVNNFQKISFDHNFREKVDRFLYTAVLISNQGQLGCGVINSEVKD